MPEEDKRLDKIATGIEEIKFNLLILTLRMAHRAAMSGDPARILAAKNILESDEYKALFPNLENTSIAD